MSTSNRVPFADRPATGMRLLREKFGLEIRTYQGELEMMTGTEEQLVATGLVRAEWFPGKPGNKKTHQRLLLEDGELVVHKGTWGRAIDERTAIDINKYSSTTYYVRFRVHPSDLPGPIRLDFIENEELVSATRELTFAAMAKAAARVCVSLKLPPSS